MGGVNIGQLDRRIIIEQPVISQDAYGAAVKTWLPFVTLWANVQDALPSQSEAVKQGLSIATNQTRIRFRYFPGVTSAMRVTIRGEYPRVLQIVGGPAEIGGRKEYIEIVVEEFSS